MENMYREKIELDLDLEEAQAEAGKLSYVNNKRRLQSAIRPGHGAILTGIRNNNSGANVGITFADRIASKYKERGISAH